MKVPLLPAILLAPLISFPTPGKGEQFTDQTYRDWQLWNGCKPLYVSASVTDDAKRKGVSEKRVASAVESRVKNAGLYNTDPLNLSLLLITVETGANSSFIVTGSLNLWFNRTVRSNRQARGPAATWSLVQHGTYNDVDFIVWGGVTKVVDDFIDKYLEVNRRSC